MRKKGQRNQPNGFPTSLLRRFAPDFCWMTAHDLYLMLEQINEDIDYTTLCVTICRMEKAGELIAKPWSSSTNPRARGPAPRLYRRVA